ncbi:MAG: ABC transporter ATP-binding protein [Amaricoccus sp.]|uniref:ABC transporter ATP-binding protein n=1 Tax=Amaricoccus sp. TaxID=1872485 RepID=UPI0033151D8C
MHDFVQFSGVQKTYDGETLIIREMDLDIAKGEFVTLLGPSGSGKSTALMLLAGFEQPTAGTIRLGGRTLNSVAPHDRNIGMVFQSYALFPHMTVAENIAYPLKVRKMPKAEITERVKRALDFVQLNSFANRYPRQMSGGQQQRVAVARALVFDPELVLMDEPLGALDKKLREGMQVEIKHIHERLGITMVFVTHDQDEALTMSDRIAVFNDGRIQQIDAPAALYERPANQFVAGFLGDTNMLAGKIVGEEAGTVVVTLANGSRVRATAVDRIGQGGGAVVSIRPERLLVNPGADVEGQLPVKLVETIYHGATARMVFHLEGGAPITAQLRAGSPLLALERGATAHVAFSEADARAFAHH